MWILDRKDLGEAVLGTLFGAAVFLTALYFRSDIASYIGETLTHLLLVGWAILWWVFAASELIDGWRFVRNNERHEREREAEDKRQQAEWEREEQERKAEWNAFKNWVEQNPATAERLMLTVEYEQIEDPEERAWRAERRQTEGPNSLTDLTRLFDWLKARRDLKKIGIDPDFPMGRHQ